MSGGDELSVLSCDLLIYNTARSRHTVIKIKSYSGWSWGGEKTQQGEICYAGLLSLEPSAPTQIHSWQACQNT